MYKTYKYYCNNEGKEILFDLEKDRQELQNVVDCEAYAQVLSMLRRDMIIRLQNAAYPNLEQSAEY